LGRIHNTCLLTAQAVQVCKLQAFENIASPICSIPRWMRHAMEWLPAFY
jgi:hypothetical protein